MLTVACFVMPFDASEIFFLTPLTFLCRFLFAGSFLGTGEIIGENRREIKAHQLQLSVSKQQLLSNKFSFYVKQAKTGASV